MLEAAFASRYLWDCLAAVEQTAIGDWQIAHVASLLGQSSLALARAQRALSCVIQNGWTDWRLVGVRLLHPEPPDTPAAHRRGRPRR